jgi:aspartate aminotransferase-like enzyme
LNSYTLFTPGPTDVPQEVLKETAQPIIYHREAKFEKLFADTCEKLKKILDTRNSSLFFFSSSGTGAMEAACCNVLSHEDKPIVAVCGKFGQRWLELCKAYQVNPIIIEEDYGKSVKPERIEEQLKKEKNSNVILTTLTETSTGALNDIKSYGEISKRYNAYLIVDGVAGIGADYCPQDDWHIDIMIGASQKALMTPPGISFVSVSKRTFEKINKSNLPKYYFSFELYDKFKTKNQTPFTPAINIFCGLNRGITAILQRGVSENFNHHKKMADYVRRRIKAIGYNIMPAEPSNALTVIKMNEDVNSTDVIEKIKNKYHILFANGQGELKGKIIRIGHMGNYSIAKLGRALDALNEVLKNWRR